MRSFDRAVRAKWGGALHPTLFIGIIGLVATGVVNLAGFLVINQQAAGFISEGWWATWFPLYVVWIVFIAIGIGFTIRKGH